MLLEMKKAQHHRTELEAQCAEKGPDGLAEKIKRGFRGGEKKIGRDWANMTGYRRGEF